MLLSKHDVTEICKTIAAEHEGWEYKNFRFVNKQLKHSVREIDPSWALRLSAEPSVMVYNKSVNEVARECFREEAFYFKYWTARMLILSPTAKNAVTVYQKLVYSLPEAEVYIRDFFQRGLELINRYFYSEDEQAFLGGYPIVGTFPERGTDSGYEWLGNCIAQAVLLNFDYVERFIADDFPTERPIDPAYRARTQEWLPVWRERAERTGSILKK